MKPGRGVLPSILLLAVFTSCSRSKEPPKERVLLDRALSALWLGRTDRPLQSIVTKSRVVSRGRAFDAETRFDPPDRFRFDAVMRSSSHTQAWNGREAFGMLDGTVIPVSEADAARLRTDAALIMASLLEPLRDPARATLAYQGLAGEGALQTEALQVEFKSTGRERFMLHFDPKTALVRRIEELGTADADRRTMIFSDFRKESGRMVAFAAEVRIGGVDVGRQTITSIRFGEAIPGEVFERPQDLNRDDVRVKDLEAETVAFAEQDGDGEDAAKTQERLFAWVKDQKLTPTGPPIHRVRRHAPLAETRPRNTESVCVPVSAPQGSDGTDPAPETRTGFGIRELPKERVLSTVHVGYLEEMDAAYRRLLDFAERNGWRVLDAAREVYIGAAPEGRVVAQVQVAVERKD